MLSSWVQYTISSLVIEVVEVAWNSPIYEGKADLKTGVFFVNICNIVIFLVITQTSKNK